MRHVIASVLGLPLFALVMLPSMGCGECTTQTDCPQGYACTAERTCEPAKTNEDQPYDGENNENDPDPEPDIDPCDYTVCKDNEECVPNGQVAVCECIAGECCDVDDDGFYSCLDPAHPEWPQEVDCDDNDYGTQPGGYEFPNNNKDDNCDNITDNTPTCTCFSGGQFGDELLAAMDLCDETIATVTQPFGDAAQFGVFPTYHDSVIPFTGGCLAVMSSGNADGSNAGGQSFGASFDDPDPEAPGGTQVYDLAQTKIVLNAPKNARGFEFDFMFMSIEWPDYLCSSFNDTFYTLLQTGAVGFGNETNVSFDTEGRPITVNVGFFELPTSWTVGLGETPYGEPAGDTGCSSSSVAECILPEYCGTAPPEAFNFIGSGSGWLKTRAPVIPGTEVTLTLSIHDEGDGVLDSSVMLDNFRWLADAPTVGTVKIPPPVSD